MMLACVAQSVEHHHGKVGVASSNLAKGSICFSSAVRKNGGFFISSVQHSLICRRLNFAVVKHGFEIKQIAQETKPEIINCI